jgi:hypothetical protein
MPWMRGSGAPETSLPYGGPTAVKPLYGEMGSSGHALDDACGADCCVGVCPLTCRVTRLESN